MFESDNGQQWRIGDLLNQIAPALPDGGATDEEDAENAERLKVIAEENDRSVGTLRRYRSTAAAFGGALRSAASFTVCKALGTPEKLAEYRETGRPLTRRAVDEWLAEGREPREPKTVTERIGDLVDEFNRMFPIVEDAAELDEASRTNLRILRLGIDTVLGE